MVYSAKSDAAGTISQFTRRKKITITTGGTSTPALYQVLLDDLAYEPEMQTSFQDIRFNTKDGAYIDYWIESHVDGVSADVWLELPDAITDPGSDYIWMYYGNAGLSDGGVGADTFIQYHGYANANFIDSLIVPYSSYIVENYVRRTSALGNCDWGLGTNQDWTGDLAVIQDYTPVNKVYLQVGNDGIRTDISETPAFTQNSWYRGKIVWTGSGSVHGYWNDNEVGSGISVNIPNQNMGLKMYVEEGGPFEQNWSFVRKYIANEPTPSYGTAQHQRRVPVFL